MSQTLVVPGHSSSRVPRDWGALVDNPDKASGLFFKFVGGARKQVGAQFPNLFSLKNCYGRLWTQSSKDCTFNYRNFCPPTNTGLNDRPDRPTRRAGPVQTADRFFFVAAAAMPNPNALTRPPSLFRGGLVRLSAIVR